MSQYANFRIVEAYAVERYCARCVPGHFLKPLCQQIRFVVIERIFAPSSTRLCCRVLPDASSLNRQILKNAGKVIGMNSRNGEECKEKYALIKFHVCYYNGVLAEGIFIGL